MEEDKFLMGQIVDGVKITSAVYKILEGLPESDPLKQKSKERALAVLENATVLFGSSGWVPLKNCLPGVQEKASLQLLEDLEMLENYCKVANNRGWISAMNFLIITNEYRNIRNRITLPSIEKIKIPKITTGVVVNNSMPVTAHQESDAGRIKPINIEKSDLLSDKLSDRQVKILKILGRRQKAQVADFIKELPNITKRTIRRDLDDLLKRGQVIRVGEWNKVVYTAKIS